MSSQVITGDCLESLRRLPDESVHCCVTSPPYWGLRDYGIDGQLGMESSPDEYVHKMTDVFREVMRVLRNDGTLWLNLGDSYSASVTAKTKTFGNPDFNGTRPSREATLVPSRTIPVYLKAKDLVGIPWLVAFALRADGWYLRQDIIWAKPNPMPESVRDRCTKSHEYLFLLTKSPAYYYDSEAIKEPLARPDEGKRKTPAKFGGADKFSEAKKQSRLHSGNEYLGTSDGKRNKRSVWNITPKPFRGAHFATFPPDLVEPCILAGTSGKGVCLECGSPWKRIVERESKQRHELPLDHPDYRPGRYTRKAGGKDEYANGGGQAFSFTQTVGWLPNCQCSTTKTRPATVIDPFCGSGTTGVVAVKLGRDFIGLELNPEYAEMSRKRIAETFPEIPPPEPQIQQTDSWLEEL